MRATLRFLWAISVVVVSGLAAASLDPARAQAPTKQIELTEKQIVGFIAAQKQMALAKAEAEFEAIAKEHGFAGLDEHDDVEANIVLLIGGIDPHSRAFTEPPVQIEQRMAAVKADKSMPEAERAQELEELAAALKTAKPIQFPGNIELVKKYYDQLQAILE